MRLRLVCDCGLELEGDDEHALIAEAGCHADVHHGLVLPTSILRRRLENAGSADEPPER